jgi:hypothetical protein
MSDNKNGKSSNNHLVRAVIAFAGHVAASVAIFIILAAAAFGLGKFVHVLEVNGASEVLGTVLTGVEYAILAADVISVLFFLWNAIKKAYKEFDE